MNPIRTMSLTLLGWLLFVIAAVLLCGVVDAQRCCPNPFSQPPPTPYRMVPMRGQWQPQVSYRETRPWFGIRWPWNANVIRYRVRREWRWQPEGGQQMPQQPQQPRAMPAAPEAQFQLPPMRFRVIPEWGEQ